MLGGIGGGDGGGGGGIFGMIGGLLDPAGLFGGGKSGEAGGGDPMGMIQKILDPAGLFPMMKGEIDKIGQKAPEDAEISALAKQRFQQERLGVDASESFNATETEPGSDLPPPAQTEVVEHSDPSHQGDGCASESHSDAGAAGDSSSTGESNSTEVDSSGDAQQTQQAGGMVAKNHASTAAEFTLEQQGQLSMIDAAISNFDFMSKDHFGNSGPLLNREFNLHRTIGNGDAMQAGAAQWLFNSPEYNLIVQLSGRSDGCISLKGLQEYRNLKAAEFRAQNGQKPAPTQNTQTPAPAPTTPPPPTEPPAMTAGQMDLNVYLTLNNYQSTVGTPPGAGTKPGTGVGGVNAANQGASLEVAIGRMDQGIAKAQQEVDGLTQKMLAGMDPKATDAQKLEGEKAKAQLSMLNLKLQSLVEMRKEMFQLLSNLWKSYHDMSMHAIGNIR